MRFAFTSAVIATTAFALDASVWTFDNDNKGPSISPENARIVLAQRLGLSRYHGIGNADEQTLQLLNAHQSPLFASEQKVRKALMIIEGLQDAFPDTAPLFTISNPPSSSSNEQLVSDFLSQDMHNREASSCGKSKVDGLVQGGFSANNPAGSCTLGGQEEFLKLSNLEQLQVLSGNADVMTSLVYGASLPPSATSDYTAIFHVKSLEDAASKHGLDSTPFKEISSTIQNTISEARKSGRFDQLIVVGTPYQAQLSKRGDYGVYEIPVPSRKEKPLRDTTVSSMAVHAQATSPSNRTSIKTTTPVCWSSESACNSNTAQCSGHGSCSKKYSEHGADGKVKEECWACACTPTTINQKNGGKKVIYWGGSACQKKDISVPFFLFAGFTIAALAGVSYGIGMLFSVGDEDLPSVLGAGVAPTVRK